MVIRIKVEGEAENFIQLQLSDIGVNISQETASRILKGLKVNVDNFNLDGFVRGISERVKGYIERYGKGNNLIEEKKEIQNMILILQGLSKSRLFDNNEKEFRKEFFDDMRLLFGLPTHKALAQKIFGIDEGIEIRYHQVKNGYLSISEKLEKKIQLLLEEALLK